MSFNMTKRQAIVPASIVVALTAGLIVASVDRIPKELPQAKAVVTQACPGGYVGITFDDGPNPNTTPIALKYLKENHMHATFFVLGKQVKQYPDLYRQIIADGHDVGVHTWDHKSLTGDSTAKQGLTTAEIENEIKSTYDVMMAADPSYKITFWRPPYGDTTPQIMQHIKAKFGLTEVGWSVTSRDTFRISSEQIVKNMSALEPGGTELSHDTVVNTVQAIPAIKKMLDSKGMCTGKLVYSADGIDGWYRGRYFAVAVPLDHTS